MSDNLSVNPTWHEPEPFNAPWALGLETDDMTAQIVNASGQHVAYVETDPLAETSYLIAAAPELLAAARLANEELLALGVGSSGSPALRSLWWAIARAEGKQK